MDTLITVTVAQCTVPIADASMAVAFVQMLVHQITPEMFLDLAHRIVRSSAAWADAKEIVAACMGSPA